ncbi:carboxymuconolactone decarboxylase family protein [Cribrihabitans neustonicus]|uniref:carboxymuconolactone decarboxylase family protein n=1 Tax=Cribrihabitans neustonicus TaxID=1429085 RepID=UPI003B5A1538
MTDFTLHTEETAPEDAKPLLAKSKAAFGFVPGLHSVMAESPQLLEAYQRVHELFQNSSLSKDELTVVWQTINVENECHYCVPAHTGIAKSMGVDDAIISALREGKPLADPKLDALRNFTLKVIRNRGNLEDRDVQDFLDAGFSKRNILEVILGYSQKIMSNYTNHLAGTPVDKVFEKFTWSKEDKAA